MDDDSHLSEFLNYPTLTPSPNIEQQQQQQQHQHLPPCNPHQPQNHNDHDHGQKKHRPQNSTPNPPRPHGAARHAKRFSLNFPIKPPTAPGSDNNVLTSPGSATSATQLSVSTCQSPGPGVPGAPGTVSTDSRMEEGYDFLTAIASQERMVLELREELQRAEMDLSTLKKRWTMSERSKKKTEADYHAEPLLALRSPTDSKLGGDMSSSNSTTAESASLSAAQVRQSRERVLRDSLRSTGTPGTSISNNGRKVFHGSHTRTLSLLSQPVGSRSGSASGSSMAKSGEDGQERIARLPRSATLPSIERSNPHDNGGRFRIPGYEYDPREQEDVLTNLRKSMPPPSRDVLMRTGKQMASDLREGLWTFLEDIRQATVGEEGVSATESRTSGLSPSSARRRDSSNTSNSRDRLSSVQRESVSRSSSSSSSRKRGSETTKSGKDTKSMDIGASFWSEFGIDAPEQTQTSPSSSTTTTTKKNNGNNNNNHRRTSKSSEASGTNTQSASNGRLAATNLLDLDDDGLDSWSTPHLQYQPESHSRSQSQTQSHSPSQSGLSHTPSSSRSTFESKQDRSRTSSPLTSAR